MNLNFPEGLTCPCCDWPTQCPTKSHDYEYSYYGKPFNIWTLQPGVWSNELQYSLFWVV